MQKVFFGKKEDAAVCFVLGEGLLAVRTHAHSELVAKSGDVANSHALDGCTLVMEARQAGVKVFRLPQTGGTLELRKTYLRADPRVRFAGSVLTTEQAQQPVLYTENIFIKFADGNTAANCERELVAAGLSVRRAVPYAKNAYFAAMPEGSGVRVFEVARQLLQREDVVYCHPEIIRQGTFKAIHPHQWHLKKTTMTYSDEVDASANVEAAHRIARGEGAVIAIIDSDVDIRHPEFSAKGKVVAPRLFLPQHYYDPRAAQSAPHVDFDYHGTGVAGVACGSGVTVSGVAPEAHLMPIGYEPDGLGSQAEADAFYWAKFNGADVINCSWGPPDGVWWLPDAPRPDYVPLPASTRLAIDDAANNGRGGLGCLIFFAAGNGNESVDADGYASHENVYAVAACNDKNTRSRYSDYGKALFCCFPSNDAETPDHLGRDRHITRGILTADVCASAPVGQLCTIDKNDERSGTYVDDFGGTSSATPGAAGVAALILSVNPKLSRHQVADIMRYSCDRIGDTEGDQKRPSELGGYDVYGHSLWYGFGRLNAEKAVLRACEALGLPAASAGPKAMPHPPQSLVV